MTDHREVFESTAREGWLSAHRELLTKEHELTEVLATKLHVPQLRGDHVGRLRLIARLNEGLVRGVALVCAPAGWGKTTLLAEWAAQAEWPVAWVSLDTEANDPARFWRYVAAALGRADGAVAQTVLPLLGPPSVASGQGIVTAMVNALHDQAGRRVLVLEDYHMLEIPSIHEDVGYLLGNLPPQLRVILASRRDPPLALSRLRAEGRLFELRTADLRFTVEESAVALRDAWKLELSPKGIATLARRTEGWAAGLQLAALALREEPDKGAAVEAFAGTHRHVLDYLSDEVMQHLRENIRTFLLQISILRCLCGPLCDVITGRSNSQQVLEEIERANLFLFPLDGERRWYRLHALFCDLLLARLMVTQAGWVSGLHRRAAAWHEQHGLIDDALRHTIAAGDTTMAAVLVEEHVNETLRRGERKILERRLATLPSEEVLSRPALSFAQAEIQFHLGRLDRVDRILARADRALASREERPNGEVPTDAGMVRRPEAAIALLRARSAGVRGDVDRMAEYARIALDGMSEAEYGPRFWARWLSGGGADWMAGRLADAERIAAAMLAEGRTAGDHYPLLTSCFSLAEVQCGRGNLSAALRTYRESLRIATEAGASSPFHEAEAHGGIARVLYQRNQLAEATGHINEAFEHGRQVIWFFEPGRRLITLAWIRQAREEPDAALDAIDEACRMHANPDIASMWIPAAAERARLLLLQGRIEEAESWTQERGLSDGDPISYPRERNYLVLARVLLARSELDRAARLLDRLDALADNQGRTESLIEIRALQALVFQAAGNHRSAIAVLADALSLARPGGYIRIFADEGPAMAALLRSLIRTRWRDPLSKLERPYIDQLVRACRRFAEQTGDAPDQTGLIDPLTKRELEVLGLIAAGSRNREIAGELVVTLDTVKKHLNHIFGKLGVSSRTEAVARARHLGLIRGP